MLGETFQLLRLRDFMLLPQFIARLSGETVKRIHISKWKVHSVGYFVPWLVTTAIAAGPPSVPVTQRDAPTVMTTLAVQKTEQEIVVDGGQSQ